MTDLKQLSDDDLIRLVKDCHAMDFMKLGHSLENNCDIELKRRLSEHNQWQDISTAPKDGTEILACEKEGTYAIISFLQSGESLFGKVFSISHTDINIADNFCPKYWQPLPTPPKED